MRKFFDHDKLVLQKNFITYVRLHWRFFMAEGLCLIFLGGFAALLPQTFTLGVTVLLGSILSIAGILQMIRAFILIDLPGSEIWLLTGLFEAAAGGYMLVNPAEGSLALTLLIIVALSIEGLGKIHLANLIKPLRHWKWLLVCGITPLLLVCLILAGWPQTGYWVLGLMLGVNMALLGACLIKLSLAHKIPSSN